MRRLLCAVLGIAVSQGMLAQATISSPNPDGVVLDPAVIFSGAGTDGTNISLLPDTVDTAVGIAVSGGIWSINVPLTVGFNSITATLGSRTVIVPVTRARGITSHAPQRVVLVWEQASEGELKEIAKETMKSRRTISNTVEPRTLSATELDDFVVRVKNRVAAIFQDNFAGAGIQLTASFEQGVHTVLFTAESIGAYGDQSVDCGNNTPAEESYVSVGYLHHRLTVDPISDWSPMEQTDEIDVRIEDIAQILARTATHETGHALGLVQESGDCGWMNGCDGFHSCQQFQAAHSGVFRFDFGRFIMDPAGLTDNFARLAERLPNQRSSARTPAQFSEFDRTYIRLIQP